MSAYGWGVPVDQDARDAAAAAALRANACLPRDGSESMSGPLDVRGWYQITVTGGQALTYVGLGLSWPTATYRGVRITGTTSRGSDTEAWVLLGAFAGSALTDDDYAVLASTGATVDALGITLRVIDDGAGTASLQASATAGANATVRVTSVEVS